MINVCIADNFPVVHFGMKAYFKDHSEISIVSNVGNFFMIPDALRNKEIDNYIAKNNLNKEMAKHKIEKVAKYVIKNKIEKLNISSNTVYYVNN